MAALNLEPMMALINIGEKFKNDILLLSGCFTFFPDIKRGGKGGIQVIEVNVNLTLLN